MKHPLRQRGRSLNVRAMLVIACMLAIAPIVAIEVAAAQTSGAWATGTGMVMRIAADAAHPAATAANDPGDAVSGDAFSDDAASGSEIGDGARCPLRRSLFAQGDPITIDSSARDALEPNRPNPFRSTTDLGYSVAAESRVVIRVYDFFYRHLLTLVDTVLPAGRYHYLFDPKGALPSGMYFYELQTDRGRELRRMMLIK